ncbi:hypothetical protein [Pontivivens insulae]|uniref:Uncharacterized protein n=1 Tax=Pontivivens insulae TaxID=1639689 RepID=A0A2R8AAE1_9RHOB|nr:hypothetical protein [Pontivivens insulae]RED13110.1 hypothetical protein DFR53_2245 [Pontivivens insulae]SPF29202.1 hypothetical protein POI8812_01509 [Pontivivens insulae]
MSEGTLWLAGIFAGIVCLVLILAVIEQAIRRPRKKSFSEKFQMDENEFRNLDTSFGNPLGGRDIQGGTDYLREMVAEKNRKKDDEEGR